MSIHNNNINYRTSGFIPVLTNHNIKDITRHITSYEDLILTSRYREYLFFESKSYSNDGRTMNYAISYDEGVSQ